jgi:HEAT repeat protein
VVDRLLRWLGLPSYADAVTHERILAIVIGSVALLLVLTLLFALIVVVLRVRHARARRRAEALEERWQGVLLDVVGGGAEPADFQALVQRGEELDVLAFLLRFARRLRGDEAHVITAIGAPFLEHAAREMRSRSPERRAQAVQALAAFGMQTHSATVLAALDDRSPYVAVTAAQALAQREHAEHAQQVMARLWRFGTWSADYLSAMLARIGPVGAAPARQLLADAAQTAHTRAVAADALRQLNDPAAADTAAAVLERSAGSPWASAPLQAACLRLLAQVGGGRPAHLAVARDFLASPHALVRGAAVRAITTMGGAAESDDVQAALADPSHWVAQEAARGLLQLGHVALLQRVASEGTPVALIARQVLTDAAGETA